LPGKPLPGVAVELQDFGQVDVAMVFRPAAIASNYNLIAYMPYFVNGVVPISPVETVGYAPVLRDDAGTRALRSRYPQAKPAGSYGVFGHRIMPGGIQRFVVAESITNGCRNCEDLGHRLEFVEFREGVHLSTRQAGWVPMLPGDSPETTASRLAQGHAQGLQVALLMAGYDTGGADGNFGPMSWTALSEFLADHCLSPAPPLTLEAVNLLSDVVPSPAPCAPGTGPAPARLPVPDGVWAADPMLCRPIDDALYSAWGHMVRSLRLEVQGATLAFGAHTCTITSTQPEGADVTAQLDCMAEGIRVPLVFQMRKITDEMVLYDRTVLRRCP
jgi:hypothetical protein